MAASMEWNAWSAGCLPGLLAMEVVGVRTWSGPEPTDRPA